MKSSAPRSVLWVVVGLLAVAVIAFVFLGGYVTRMETSSSASPQSAAASASSGDQFSVLQEIYATLQRYYVDPSKVQNVSSLRQGAIDGLLNTVGDTHQTYVPREDVESEQIDLSGQFQGIGATMGQKNGEVYIESMFPDYPASKSNLRIGDVILAVDGQSVVGKPANEIVKLVRGQAGSQVKLTVKHNDGKQEDVSLTRAQIKIASVHTEQLKDANGQPVDDIAYLRISQFQVATDKEVADFLKGIQGKPYKGLILDLRNNPGGLLSTTESILSDFLKPGQVELITQGRSSNETTDKAQNGAATTNLPIVVLVNKNSASASEITAGALRDDGRATIMGEQTFGKGTVNQFITLPKDGGELYVSVGRWLTPKHDTIEGKGITPDVVVHIGDNEDINNYINAQLFQAIDYLHSKAS